MNILNRLFLLHYFSQCMYPVYLLSGYFCRLFNNESCLTIFHFRGHKARHQMICIWKNVFNLSLRRVFICKVYLLLWEYDMNTSYLNLLNILSLNLFFSIWWFWVSWDLNTYMGHSNNNYFIIVSDAMCLLVNQVRRQYSTLLSPISPFLSKMENRVNVWDLWELTSLFLNVFPVYSCPKKIDPSDIHSVRQNISAITPFKTVSVNMYLTRQYTAAACFLSLTSHARENTWRNS